MSSLSGISLLHIHFFSVFIMTTSPRPFHIGHGRRALMTPPKLYTIGAPISSPYVMIKYITTIRGACSEMLTYSARVHNT